MMLKKILFITLIVIIISSISVISANEIQDNQTTTSIETPEQQTTSIETDSIPTETQENTKTIKKTEHADTKELANEEATTYQELYNKLASTDDDNITITLTGEDTYEITDTIILKDTIKNLKIEGNGKTIDGQNRKQFLTINHPANITINNLTLTRCNLTEDKSGAITVYNSNLTVNNSKFVENNCSYLNNNLKHVAGIFYVNNSNMVLDNSVFETNDVDYGTEILFESMSNNITILNSNFTNNGYKYDNSNPYSPREYNNQTIFITTNGTVLVSNSRFSSNSNFNGALTFIGGEESKIMVDNSTFNENFGGSLHIESNGTVTVNQTNFTNNSISYGGALYYEGQGTLSVLHSNFDSNGQILNTYLGYNGGALHILSNGTVYLADNTYKSNYAYESGGAIYYEGYINSELEIRDSIFESNGLDEVNHNPNTSLGGALYLDNYGQVTINNTDFLSNHADSSGGAIWYNGLENYDFKIINSTFDSNSVSLDGYAGALYVYQSSGDIILDKVKVLNSYATYSGAMHMLYVKNIIINECDFKNNHAQYSEGVAYIYTEGNITINQSNFTNNSAQSEYGVANIYAEGSITINQSNFTSNSAQGSYGVAYIYSYENIFIDQSHFINNTAKNGDNGALYLDNDNELSITDSSFISNKAEVYGALYIGNNRNTSINNTLFSENSATYIGTLSIDSDNASVTYTNFTNNTAGGSDYEIAVLESNGNVVLNHTNFIGNKILDRETKISCIMNYGSLSIDNSNFTDNYGNEYGAIVHSGNNLTINHTYFKNNTVTGVDFAEGGAIYVDAGNTRIDNSIFINNNARADRDENSFGGAISVDYNRAGKPYIINLTNCAFINNYPANFVIKEDIIQFDTTGDQVRNDSHIPSNANVTIYVNNNTEGQQCTLENNRITDFSPSHDDYLYRLVLNGSQDASYIQNNGWFQNNIYYISIPHDYILMSNATDVNYGENVTINGTLYYMRSDGTNKTLSNEEIQLYINGTYINSTQTDDEGRYSFNYTALVIGTHEVTVKIVSDYIGEITNKTTFNVSKIKTKLIIEAENTTVNEETKIKVTLLDLEENPIEYADIKLFIDNEIYSISTDESGVYEKVFNATLVGENHVFALYDGNYSYANCYNLTLFMVNRINTTITVNAQNTTMGENITITGTLKDKENKPISNATIIVIIDEEEITTNTTETGEYTIKYTTKYMGNNYIEVFYEGNNTYGNAINHTLFYVDKINTTTNAIPVTQKVGNLTIKADIKGKDEKQINNGTILVTNPKGEKRLFDIEDTTTTITITDITSGTYTYTITYTGNETYNPSNKTVTVTILPEAQISIEITNNTEKNVTIQVTATDETGTPLGGQEVNITLPNGTTITKNTDSEGKIIVTDTTAETGQKTVTAEILGNDEITGTSETVNVTIEPDYNKIIEEMNQTIKDLNDINRKLNETINNLTEELSEARDTINNLTEELSEARDTINNLTEELSEARDTINNLTEKLREANNKIENLTNALQEAQEEIKNLTDELEAAQEEIKDLNNRIDELEKLVEELEEILDTHNKTSKITAVPTNGTVGDNNVIVTLENMLGTPIADAPVTVKNSKGETIANAKTDKDGIVIVPVDTQAGKENITVSYAGDKYYKGVNATVSITTSKNNVTVTVDPVEGIIGEDITLTAHINDNNGNPVNGGNLVFKLNGKTLRTDGSFNSTATPWKFQVKDGKVTVTIKADLYLRNIKNLTASYSGTYKYNEAKSSTVTAQIKKRNAQVSVTASPKSQKQYNTITISAKLTDTTKGTKNKTAISTDTKVLFKINGKTIKEGQGNNLLVNVVNATATYKYTVPAGMGGINKDGEVRDYTVEAVVISDTFYPDTRNTTSFNVERSPVTININNIQVNAYNQLSIKADIKDYKGKNVVGNNTVNIKINGKSYVNPKTKKVQNFKVSGGKIDLRNIAVSSDITVKKVMIVSGARQAYLGQRIETSSIVRT